MSLLLFSFRIFETHHSLCCQHFSPFLTLRVHGVPFFVIAAQKESSLGLVGGLLSIGLVDDSDSIASKEMSLDEFEGPSFSLSEC
jgi:hypothetical protein